MVVTPPGPLKLGTSDIDSMPGSGVVDENSMLDFLGASAATSQFDGQVSFWFPPMLGSPSTADIVPDGCFHLPEELRGFKAMWRREQQQIASVWPQLQYMYDQPVAVMCPDDRNGTEMFDFAQLICSGGAMPLDHQVLAMTGAFGLEYDDQSYFSDLSGLAGNLEGLVGLD